MFHEGKIWLGNAWDTGAQSMILNILIIDPVLWLKQWKAPWPLGGNVSLVETWAPVTVPHDS